MANRPGRAVVAIVVGASAILFSHRVLAYDTVMIRDSGSASNRINIVILGDGYLASELTQLETDVRTAFTHIADEPFYAQYANFINVKLVLSTSSSNVIGNGAPGATLFGLYFGCQGIERLICIGDSARVASVLNQDAPEWDLVAIIANSAIYGGSGGQFATFTREASSTQLFVHETAHQFANLADEYPDAYPSYPSCGAECPEPNVTPVASSWQSLKWNYWVDPATPLPTPDEAQYADTIGAFEGARYQSTGLFRPRHTCRMRETVQQFCEICAEAHVLELYRFVNTFDEIQPSNSAVSLSAGASTQLSVVHPQTASNSVKYAWSIDGSAVAGSDSALSLSASGLGPGAHSVDLQLSDMTALVGRDDALLHKSHSWQVTVQAATGGTVGSGGSIAATGGTMVVGSGGSIAATGGTMVVGTGGSIAATGGTMAVGTGGSIAATGGTMVVGTGGSVAAAGATFAVVAGTAGTMAGATFALVAGAAGTTAGATAGNVSGASGIAGGGSPAAASGTAGIVAGATSDVGGRVGTSGGIGANAGAGDAVGGVGTSSSHGGKTSRSSNSSADSKDSTVACNCGLPGTTTNSASTLALGAILLALKRWRLRRFGRHFGVF
jgi:hypothetical protein